MAAPQAENVITDRNELKRLFGTTPNLIGDVPIDVLRREINPHEYLVTDKPVESGASITDARIRQPEIVRLECIITDDLSDVSIGSIAQVVKDGLQTWREKLTRLREIENSNELIEVTTPLETYSDCVIRAINIEQTPETSQALFFTVELKEVRLVTAQLEQVSEAAIPKRKKAKKQTKNDTANDKSAKEQERGKRATQEPSNSILANLLGA